MIFRMLMLVIALSGGFSSTFASTFRGNQLITAGGGVAGVAGTAGATGTPGIPGAPGIPGVSVYGFFYNLVAYSVPLNTDVHFDSNGAFTPTGFLHVPAADPTGAPIIVLQSGTYWVMFSVSGAEPSQFGLFLNGVVVPGTIYGSGAGAQQNTGQAILTIAAGTTLTLRNFLSPAAVGLASMVGGTIANTNASIFIVKLGS